MLHILIFIIFPRLFASVDGGPEIRQKYYGSDQAQAGDNLVVYSHKRTHEAVFGDQCQRSKIMKVDSESFATNKPKASCTGVRASGINEFGQTVDNDMASSGGSAHDYLTEDGKPCPLSFEGIQESDDESSSDSSDSSSDSLDGNTDSTSSSRSYSSSDRTSRGCSSASDFETLIAAVKPVRMRPKIRASLSVQNKK